MRKDELKMKRYLCLILCLALLLTTAAVQAENSSQQAAYWLSDSNLEGAYSPIGNLPLQVFIPDTMAKSSINEISENGGLVLFLDQPDIPLYVFFSYYPKAPIPCTQESVDEYQAKGYYADYELINGMPVLSYFYEETGDNGAVWSYEYAFYDLQNGSCLLELRKYPSGKAEQIPYELDSLRYSVFRND